MLDELRKVIPSFLKRVDLPDRGGAWSDVPRADPRTPWTTSPTRLFAGDEPAEPAPDGHARRLRPRRRGQAPRRHAATRTRTCPSDQIARPGARAVAPTSASRCVRAYVGERANRRHKPGRALERIDYRFDVLADYGAFRDLQRHRMLTIEWQPLTPAPRLRPGPSAVDDAGLTRPRSTTRWTARPRCYDALVDRFPAQAPYAVSLAYRVRFVHADERPRGDAPARAAHRARRATPRTAGSPRRCTASSPSRPATPRWPR